VTLVLDASAALAWLFERADRHEAGRADRLLDAVAENTAIVPMLWHCEVCNALLTAERRKVITEAQSADFLARLSRLPIDTDATPLAQRREVLIALGRRFQLSAYDAGYLDLALHSNATLASFDRKLLDAMRKAGGQVFE
jgi:predicted nucleic acid-binding protein